MRSKTTTTESFATKTSPATTAAEQEFVLTRISDASRKSVKGGA